MYVVVDVTVDLAAAAVLWWVITVICQTNIWKGPFLIGSGTPLA
jgi:hypothetical protein